MSEIHFLLYFLLIIWCALHSFLISMPVNNWLSKQDVRLRGTYRLVYSLFAGLTLLPLLWVQYSLPQEIIFSWSGWLRIPQLLLLAYALIFLIGGQLVYDLSYLVGIRQWQTWQQGKELPMLPFTSKGVLHYVRHPWYSAGFPILWTVGPITDANWPSRLIFTFYLIIGTVLEERKLLQELGEPYRQYCQQVPMLFPWKGRVEVKID
jgi:protein-S-isoprenylcysteine O-methyltransferase Ste14